MTPEAEAHASVQPDTILRVDAVAERIGLARPTIYRMVKDGEFPRPVKITTRAVGWRESDLSAWIASRKPADPPAPGGRKPGGEARAAAG